MARRAVTLDAAAFQRRATEDEMTAAIADIVKLKQGELWHLRDARRAPELENLTDLIIVIPGLAALVELKSQDRGITFGQRRVLTLLETVERFFGGVVRPEPNPGETSYDDFLDILRG